MKTPITYLSPIHLKLEVTNDVTNFFARMDQKRTFRFITFKIGPRNIIDVENVGGRESTFEDFLTVIPRDEPRFVIYDVPCETCDCRKYDKMLFVYWCPEDVSSSRLKVQYATTKKLFSELFQSKGSLNPSNDIEIHDIDELCLNVFVAKASRNGKD